MNLAFAMELSLVQEIIEDGNIAVCPIRQIGKSNALMNVVYKDLRDGAPLVIVVCPSLSMAEIFIDNCARQFPGILSKRVMACWVSDRIPDCFRGVPVGTRVYFEEYLDLSEQARTLLYQYSGVSYFGGTATLR